MNIVAGVLSSYFVSFFIDFSTYTSAVIGFLRTNDTILIAILTSTLKIDVAGTVFIKT
jgi:hypothetical protein